MAGRKRHTAKGQVENDIAKWQVEKDTLLNGR